MFPRAVVRRPPPADSREPLGLHRFHSLEQSPGGRSRRRVGEQPCQSSGWRGKFALIALLSTIVPTIAAQAARLPFGGGSLYYSDLLLPLAAAAVLGSVSRLRGSWVAWILLLSAVGLVLEGKLNLAENRWIIRDARPALYIGLGTVLGLYLARDRRNWHWHLSVTTWFFAIVGGLVAVSQVYPVVGDADATNALFYGTDVIQLSSRRTQIETNPAALVVLAGIIGAFLAGRRLRPVIGPGPYWTLLGATFVTQFLSYSRNTLLGLGAAVVASQLTVAPHGRVERLLRTLSVLAVCAIAIAPVLYLAVASGLVGTQIETYLRRVVGGLRGESMAIDASILWRDIESGLARDAIAENPVSGLGLGVFYRPHVTGEAISEDGGLLYVHNYWLWVLVKGGYTYLAVILIVWFTALYKLLIRAADQPVAVALGCGLAAVLACAFVAPWPAQANGAAVFGAIAGAAMVLAPAPHRRPATSQRRSSTVRPSEA